MKAKISAKNHSKHMSATDGLDNTLSRSAKHFVESRIRVAVPTEMESDMAFLEKEATLQTWPWVHLLGF